MDSTQSNMEQNSENQWVMTRREDVNPKLLNIVSAVLDIFPELPESVQKIRFFSNFAGEYLHLFCVIY